MPLLDQHHKRRYRKKNIKELVVSRAVPDPEHPRKNDEPAYGQQVSTNQASKALNRALIRNIN
ncbi:hypothetical protein D3C79_886170 [compost metagenome]